MPDFVLCGISGGGGRIQPLHRDKKIRGTLGSGSVRQKADWRFPPQWVPFRNYLLELQIHLTATFPRRRLFPHPLRKPTPFSKFPNWTLVKAYSLPENRASLIQFWGQGVRMRPGPSFGFSPVIGEAMQYTLWLKFNSLHRFRRRAGSSRSTSIPDCSFENHR